MKHFLYNCLLFFFVLLPLSTMAQNKQYLRDSSLVYRDSLKKAFQQTQDLQKLIKIVRKAMYIFDVVKINPTESDEVLQFYLAEVKAKRTNDKILPYIQNALGFVYYLNPKASMLAGDYFLQSLEHIENTQDLEWISRTYQHVGNIFYHIGDYETAMRYFSKYAQNVEKIPIEKGLVISSYNTMALIFQKMEKIDSALVYYEKGLKRAYVEKNRLWEGLLKGNIGSIRHNQKRYAEALPLLEKDVEISLENKLFANAVLSLSDIIRTHIAQKNYQEAKKRLLQGDSLLSKIERIPVDIKALAEFYEISADYYEAMQDFKQEAYYRRMYEKEDKEYRKYIKDIDIQRIKFRYDYETKQRDIEKLTAKAELQQTYLYIVGFVLLTVLLLIVVLAQRFYQKNVLMTRLKLQHEQIKQYNEELLQNVEHISAQTQVIETQNQALQASNLSKDKIFSLISHDLRSPLAGLKGVVRLLKHDLLTIEELQNILPTLENNLDYTLNLTEELLYWAKSQMEGMQASPIILNPHIVIEQTIVNLQKTAEAKGITLLTGEVLDLPAVWADENMIKAVLRNLVSNAIKFCKDKDTITVSATEAGKGEILFKVIDTGTGMKPEILAKMFKDEPVTTQGTAGEKGTGFGLMMCKDFIVQNGGKIGVDSTWGKGSEFYFTLPISAQGA
jgi:signal transduction histidine kinase